MRLLAILVNIELPNHLVRPTTLHILLPLCFLDPSSFKTSNFSMCSIVKQILQHIMKELSLGDLISSTQGNFTTYKSQILCFFFLNHISNFKPSCFVKSITCLLQLLGNTKVKSLRSCAPQQTL
jgi:hypothetical protein